MLIAVLIGFGACASNTQYIERRNHVTYSSTDWAHSDMRGLAGTPAQPEGGMRAFVSRLDYPANLRRRHVAGVMTVQVSLDANGRVVSAKVLQSVHPQLDAIVLRAVHETRWKTATRAGKPVAFKFKFPVTFREGA